MNDFQSNIETIEAYLRDELSPELKADFEARMKTEEGLSEQVKTMKDLILGVSLAAENRIKKKLDSVESNLNKETFFVNKPKEIKMSNSSKFRWIPLAASMLLLAAVGLFFLKSDEGTNPDMGQLYSEYYKPDTKVVNEILDRMEAKGLASETDEDEEKLKAALQAYSKYDYNSARSQLSSFLDEFPENQTARFYMGLTQMNLGNYALSTEYLQPLCTEDGFAYKDQAKWYLALGCTQIEGPDGLILAKKYFKQLAQDNKSEYQGNAKAYLEHLGE